MNEIPSGVTSAPDQQGPQIIGFTDAGIPVLGISGACDMELEDTGGKTPSGEKVYIMVKKRDCGSPTCLTSDANPNSVLNDQQG